MCMWMCACATPCLSWKGLPKVERLVFSATFGLFLGIRCSESYYVLVKSEATPYWQCLIQMYFGTVWTVWVPKKMCSKKVLVILFPYIFHVKPNYSLQILKNKVISRDSNILPQMYWTSDIFGHSATIIGGFQVSLNYSFLNFKKMVCPKNIWMQHWLGA